MRPALRLLSAVVLVTAITSCLDMSAPSGASRRALTVVPHFTESASRASATLAQAGLAYNAVRLVIIRPTDPPDTLRDTTFVYGPGSPELTLALGVDAIPSEELLASLEFKQDNQVIFSGTATVKAVSPAAATPATAVEVQVDYTGPGFDVVYLTVSPGPGIYSANSGTQFTAKAFDISDAEVAGAPIFWSVSDPSLATISASGLLTPTGNRGTVDVTATAANGASTTIGVQLAPQAAGLRVVQGAGQSGTPGTTLPAPVIVELTAADGFPAAGAGQTVSFSASPGASISPSSTTLDANGRASAMVTVGSTSGTTYIFTAQVGAFEVSWGETAKPSVPTHFVPSGPTTLELTAGVVPDPVPTLRVADDLENSVTGVILRVTIQEGGVNVIDPFQVPADSVGLLEVYKVAPTKAGVYTILVEAADPGLSIPPLLYDVTVKPGPAAKLEFTQDPPTTVTSGQPVSVEVTVRDEFGNTVTSSTQTISIAAEPGAAGWSATGSAAAVNGVATISVTITTTSGAQSGVKLRASGGSLAAALSGAFSITP